MSSQGTREDIHRHSGWLIPLGFAAAILLLCALLLGWYLRPGPRGTAPTDRSALVQLTVAGRALAVPANYIENPAARAGGALEQLSLAALFPSWAGYTDGDAHLFAGNAPDSPLVRITLRGTAGRLSAPDRLARIYRPYVTDPAGTPTPFGLTQYVFRPGSGYERGDLFAGDRNGLVLFLCERSTPDVTSPNCLVADQSLGDGLSMSYRFKRAYLAHWREITDGVNGLVRRLGAR